MNLYTLNERIHSCTIDKDLLINLEECILDSVLNDIIGSYLDEKFKKEYIDIYNISIKEKNGTITFESIKNYDHSLLPDDTKEIKYNVKLMKNKIPDNNIGLAYVSIEINFSNSRKPRIRIEIKSDNKSKEIAVSISNLIKEIIEKKYNFHYIYHLDKYFKKAGYFIYSFLIAAFFALSIIMMVDNLKYKRLVFIMDFVFVFYIIGMILNPYIYFKTNKSNWKKELHSYLIGIVIGIFIINFFSNIIF